MRKIVKTIVSGVAVAAIAATMACGAVATAFADTTYPAMNVTFTVPGTSTTTTVAVPMSPSSSQPTVAGQFYKNGVWNVIATESYVTLDSMIESAIDEYNATAPEALEYEEVWNSSMQISATAIDGAYTKYHWTKSEIESATNFYNVGNATTTLAASSKVSGVNSPAVFTYDYGLAAVPSGSTAGSTLTSMTKSGTTCTNPRLVLGCDDGWTTSQAMGKRYCFDVTGITIEPIPTTS